MGQQRCNAAFASSWMEGNILTVNVLTGGKLFITVIHTGLEHSIRYKPTLATVEII